MFKSRFFSGLLGWGMLCSKRNQNFRLEVIALIVSSVGAYRFLSRVGVRYGGLLCASSARDRNVRLLDLIVMMGPGKRLVDMKASIMSAAFSLLGQCLFVHPQVVGVLLSEHIARGRLELSLSYEVEMQISVG